MEGQLLYFTYSPRERVWKTKSIPVSHEYIDSVTPSSLSRNLRGQPQWNMMELLVAELSRLFTKNGGMEGWKLHWLGELEVVHDSLLSDRIYGAKAVLTRPIELPAPPVTPANEPL